MTDSFQNIEVISIPDITKIDYKSVEKKYLNIILINIAFIFLALFTLLFFFDYKDVFELGISFVWFYMILIIVFVFIFLLKIIGFKKRKYAIREKDISYKEGLFYKNLATVPFNRIQHIEIDQGPVSRFYNLSTLSVFTAGDSSDDLQIRGLLTEDAQKIKEFISNKIHG